MAESSILDEQLQSLLTQYLDPRSAAHLELNSQKILKELKEDSKKFPATIPTIRFFRDSLSFYSRARDRYMLRGRRRYNSFRKYVSFSPESVLCGEEEEK